MHLSQSAAVLTIGLLLAGAYCSADERSASSSQRYRVHVPSEIKFGRVQPASITEPAAQPAQNDVESLVFMAETTSGMTFQFETQSEPSRKQPLKLSVSGNPKGSRWANAAHDVIGSTYASVAEAAIVQATTTGAGWTTLQLDVANPPAAVDAEVTTIVVTIVAH